LPVFVTVLPVPDRETLTGLLPATASVPVRDPFAVGRKVTLAVQDAPAAMLVPQVFVCEKSPLVLTPDTDAAAVPLLEIVTFCALLAEPTFVAANDKLVGDADTLAEPPPPVVPPNTWNSDT
jgi:hypothetical protein